MPRWVLPVCALAAATTVGLAVFPAPQLGLWGQPGCLLPIGGCTRVLFIGNSYTAVNDLPTTFADLAWAGGHRVETEALDAGGWTLAEHASDPATGTALSSEPWNVVVLQEQSQIPSVPSMAAAEMYPAVTTLVAEARQHGARPLLYLTFAHQDGWPQVGLDDYASMQAAINTGYMTIAQQLGVAVAPVGVAWEKVAEQPGAPTLWQSDGSHPATAGTYLAACVFYAAIFDRSPVGLGDDDGLQPSEAASLQAVAAETVLDDPPLWDLAG